MITVPSSGELSLVSWSWGRRPLLGEQADGEQPGMAGESLLEDSSLGGPMLGPELWGTESLHQLESERNGQIYLVGDY